MQIGKGRLDCEIFVKVVFNQFVYRLQVFVIDGVGGGVVNVNSFDIVEDGVGIYLFVCCGVGFQQQVWYLVGVWVKVLQEVDGVVGKGFGICVGVLEEFWV